MAAPSKRIPLNPIQNGLNQAFASLEMSGLPQGPGEGKGTPESQSPPHEQLVPGKPGRVVLRREKAHRGGKTVLVVDGFGSQHTDLAIEALGKRLRSGCGCGGTVRGRAIELQGDQPGRIRTFLEGEGFQVAGEK